MDKCRIIVGSTLLILAKKFVLLDADHGAVAFAQGTIYTAIFNLGETKSSLLGS